MELNKIKSTNDDKKREFLLNDVMKIILNIIGLIACIFFGYKNTIALLNYAFIYTSIFFIRNIMKSITRKIPSKIEEWIFEYGFILLCTSLIVLSLTNIKSTSNIIEQIVWITIMIVLVWLSIERAFYLALDENSYYKLIKYKYKITICSIGITIIGFYILLSNLFIINEKFFRSAIDEKLIIYISIVSILCLLSYSNIIFKKIGILNKHSRDIEKYNFRKIGYFLSIVVAVLSTLMSFGEVVDYGELFKVVDKSVLTFIAIDCFINA